MIVVVVIRSIEPPHGSSPCGGFVYAAISGRGLRVVIPNWLHRAVNEPVVVPIARAISAHFLPASFMVWILVIASAV
jgi:hypothetical protein